MPCYWDLSWHLHLKYIQEVLVEERVSRFLVEELKIFT